MNLQVIYFSLFYCFLVITFLPRSSRQNPNVCQTPQCLASAKNLLESMDPTVNPCDDFYQYACGSWPKVHLTQTEYAPLTTVTLRAEENSEEILRYLKRNNSDEEPAAVHKARKLFSLCLDTDLLDRKGSEPITELLKLVNLTVYPPLLERSKNFDLITTMVKMQKLLGINAFFKIIVTPHPQDQTRNIIGIAKPDPYFSSIPTFQHRLRKGDIIDGKTNYVLSIFTSLCDNSTLEFCHQCMSYKNILEGFHALNAFQRYQQARAEVLTKSHPKTGSSAPCVTYTLEKLQSMTNNITEIQENSKITPLNWTKILSIMFEDTKSTNVNWSDAKNTLILIEETFMRDILHFIHSQSLHDLEIGLWWTVVDTFSMYANAPLRNSKTKWAEEITGKTSRESWCSETTSHVFGMAVGYYYVTNSTYNETKFKVQQMVDNVLNAYKKIINETTWMDPITKSRALNKTESITSFVAYPDFIENKTELDEYYKDVQITDDFIESMVKFVRITTLDNLNSLNETNDDSVVSPELTPIMVNAFFDPQRNIMAVPAGILGFPIFGNGIEALNYGFIGNILGHELTHNLDTQGRYFDHKGNIEDWWENKTLTEFNKRAECFVNAYENYTSNFGFQEFRVDSSVTLPENMADNGGFREALFAYKEYLVKHGDEPVLPNFENFTNEQMFTLGFANLWCEHNTLFSALIQQFSTHSPNPVRVNGVATNSEEFSNIWNCTKGTKMNPDDEKCYLW